MVTMSLVLFELDRVESDGGYGVISAARRRRRRGYGRGRARLLFHVAERWTIGDTRVAGAGLAVVRVDVDAERGVLAGTGVDHKVSGRGRRLMLTGFDVELERLKMVTGAMLVLVQRARRELLVKFFGLVRGHEGHGSLGREQYVVIGLTCLLVRVVVLLRGRLFNGRGHQAAV